MIAGATAALLNAVKEDVCLLKAVFRREDCPSQFGDIYLLNTRIPAGGFEIRLIQALQIRQAIQITGLGA